MTTMQIDRAVVQQVLEALLNFPEDISDEMFASLTALKAALAQEQAEPTGKQDLQVEPVQEPVAWMDALKDAFFEGFTSVATYNDTLLNSPEEAWNGYKPPRTTPPRCPNCASLEAQNNELDRKLAELEGRPCRR